MNLGMSYSPLAQDETKKQQEQTGPVQQAIQLLGLRMPSVRGAQGMAPGMGPGGISPLYGPAGQAPDIASFQELLRRLAMQAGTGGLNQLSAPAPNVSGIWNPPPPPGYEPAPPQPGGEPPPSQPPTVSTPQSPIQELGRNPFPRYGGRQI